MDRKLSLMAALPAGYGGSLPAWSRPHPSSSPDATAPLSLACIFHAQAPGSLKCAASDVGRHRYGDGGLPLSASQPQEIAKDTLKDRVDNLYRHCIPVDIQVYVDLIRCCGEEKSLRLGNLVHCHMVASGLGNVIFLWNLLIEMYGRCGALQQARAAFDQMPEKTACSRNIMISAYVSQGQQGKAQLLFHQMHELEEEVDEITVIMVLNACANEHALSDGRYVHSCIIAYGFESDLVVGTVLMNMYGRCKSMDDAQRAFKKLQKKDMVSWNSMIGLQVHQGLLVDAFHTFEQMKKEGFLADFVTFLSLLEASSILADLCEGRIVHSGIVDAGYGSFVVVGNALINMYSKCGSLEDAINTFMRMVVHDVVSWNAIIAAHTQHGLGHDAIKIYKQMIELDFMPSEFTFSSIISACANVLDLESGLSIHVMIIKQGVESDVPIGTALIDMYTKCERLEDARKLFNMLHRRSVHVWTVMIFAYAQHGQGEEALKLFREMQSHGLRPDEVSFASALGACALLSDLNEGRSIHASLQRLGFDSYSIEVGEALINMYGKCGNLKEAQMVFDGMPKRNIMSWNALMAAYSQHGFGREALKIFCKMLAEGVKPNDITFVTVLSACSHEGLVGLGVQLFDSMQDIYDIVPAVGHYGCLVDLYARSGHLKKADDVIRTMPFPPNSLIWKSLFGGCCTYGDIERGRLAAEQASKLDSEEDSSYVLSSNICRAEMKWFELSRFQKRMLQGTKGHERC